MQNTIKILIDLKKEIYRFDQAQQGDDVILDITLLENGVAKDLTGETVELIYINANNTVASVTGEKIVVNGNNVKITCPTDCTRSYGIAKFQLKVVNTYQVSTFPIALTIVPSVDQNQQISQNISTILEHLTAKNIECDETLDSLNTWVSTHGDIVNLDTRMKSAESQLAENTQEIKSLASGSPKGTFATVSELTLAYPTGNTNIYVVTADGNWYYWNGSAWTPGGLYQSTGVEDGSITPTKTTFIKKSTNLFNKNNLIDGKALDTTSGLPIDNTTFGYTPQYEPIMPNTKYAMSVNMTELTTIRAFHYDKDLNYVSQVALTNTSGSPVIINGSPEYAYVRFSVRNTADANSLQYNKGIEVLSYEPYYQVLDDSIDLPGMTQENEIWEVL